MTPPGAQKLIDIRKRRLVPDCPVIVSFVGNVPCMDTLHIYPKSGGVYEWSFMAGLDAYVVVGEKTDAEHCIKSLHELRGGMSPYVGVVDADRRLVSFIVSLNPTMLMECKPECDWWQQFFGGES